MKHFFLPFCLLLTSLAGRTQDTAGIYYPVLLNQSAGITVNLFPSHFVKVDSEVIVFGHAILNGFPTVGKKYHISVSIPFPSTFTNADYDVIGDGFVFQSTTPPVADLVQEQIGQIFIFWNPSESAPGNMFYKFIYTIK